jgi:hypothetical protein
MPDFSESCHFNDRRVARNDLGLQAGLLDSADIRENYTAWLTTLLEIGMQLYLRG